MVEHDEKQARNWGMFCHLAALTIWLGIPFGNIIGPLLIWLIKKDELPIVEREGKESLNFQITMSIYIIIAAILCIVLIGIPILIGLVVAQIALVIIAAVKVSNGEAYRYPFTLRFIN
jgi:hypothetical protein